ncbi:hypothetical protein NECAME_06093 [Necator americanus]|uniref:Uncharacterized protein n=1 Tax=Necator americanus TaxID=51031 RepID=W2TVJ5_NECAM|nr:hypothetical protein NECAME_06093 [Necator americanus]ETN86120.1 hypothetical protein NECAME_06093 [Necator americanus]
MNICSSILPKLKSIDVLTPAQNRTSAHTVVNDFHKKAALLVTYGFIRSVHPREAARRAAHFGLAAAGADEARLRDVVHGVIEEVRIERSLKNELKD